MVLGRMLKCSGKTFWLTKHTKKRNKQKNAQKFRYCVDKLTSDCFVKGQGLIIVDVVLVALFLQKKKTKKLTVVSVSPSIPLCWSIFSVSFTISSWKIAPSRLRYMHIVCTCNIHSLTQSVTHWLVYPVQCKCSKVYRFSPMLRIKDLLILFLSVSCWRSKFPQLRFLLLNQSHTYWRCCMRAV